MTRYIADLSVIHHLVVYISENHYHYHDHDSTFESCERVVEVIEEEVVEEEVVEEEVVEEVVNTREGSGTDVGVIEEKVVDAVDVVVCV